MQTNNSKEKVRQLQNKLYLTAKKCDSRRFHALYDKVYRDDVLYEAWKRVKANKGTSGVDGITIEGIETKGVPEYLTEIQAELKSGNYRPKPVRRVMIPKSDGSQRPLGIPCVKDRIVQMAAKIAIEPVFEADCFLASNFPHFHRYDSLKSALYIHAVSKNINTFPKNQGRIRAAIAVEILDFTVMYR